MLEKLKLLVEWFQVQGPLIASAIMAFLGLGEAVVRLTPTEKDDTFVERIGTAIRRFFDLIGLPNYKSGGGKHLPADEMVVVPKSDVEKTEV